MHFGLWAPSCVRFIVSLFNWNEDKYASYIEHEMSNMIPVTYIGSLIALTIDSNRNPDLQSYLELFMYALFYVGAAFFVELTTGVGAIRHLDPNYPYADPLLLPSIGYYFGWWEHVDHISAKLNHYDDGESGTDDLPFQNDPSIRDDIIIDNF